jgi:ribosomal subunit interface protein
MRVEVVGRGIDITDAISGHAEAKCEKLHRFFNGIQLITLTVTQEDHAKHGLYDVELLIDVEHHDDFICRARGDDLYATIDQVVAKGQRQLTDFKEKLRNGKR